MTATDATAGGAVQVRDDGPVRHILFDRPDKLNAFREQDLDAVRAAVEGVPDDCAVIVFRGAGRAFSAGMDVATFVRVVEQPDLTRQVIGAVKALLDAVRTAEVVTVAAVDGHCLGVAFELIMACDARVATPHSRLGLPEMNLGLPCILESALLQQYVGLSRAKMIMLTGDLYDAGQMLDWGLLSDVVPDDQFDDHVGRLVSRLAAKPRPGIAAQKRLFERWQNEGLQASNAACLDEIEGVFRHPATRTLVEQVAAGLSATAATDGR